jgi:hypothetical protein
MAIEKIKSQKSPSIYQIPAELIKAGGRTIRSEIHKLINSIWNKEDFSKVWKELIIVHAQEMGDKTDCSNYKGITLLSTRYQILSHILRSRLTPYAEEIIGDHQCGF